MSNLSIYILDFWVFNQSYERPLDPNTSSMFGVTQDLKVVSSGDKITFRENIYLYKNY